MDEFQDVVPQTWHTGIQEDNRSRLVIKRKHIGRYLIFPGSRVEILTVEGPPASDGKDTLPPMTRVGSSIDRGRDLQRQG